MPRSAAIAGILFVMTAAHAFADNGLVSKSSKYSAQETIDRFEAAVKSQAANGWTVFNRIDRAAAAKQAGLDIPAPPEVVSGKPKAATPPMHTL